MISNYSKFYGKWFLMLTLLLLVLLTACGNATTSTGSGNAPKPSASATQTANASVTVKSSATPTSGANQAATPTSKPTHVVTLSFIHMLNTTAGWAVTKDEAILSTTDGGVSWQDVTPKYPANILIPGGVRVEFLSGTLAWIAVSQVQQSDFTYPTTVFRTSDGGQTWQGAKLPGSQLGVSQVSFINAQNGWVLSSLGGGAAGSQAVDIFRTTDGGKTWAKASSAQASNSTGVLPFSGNKSGLSFINASTGWVTGATAADNFAWFYVTTDGGFTWQHQSLPYPPNVSTAQISLRPPTFFSANDGVLPAGFGTPRGYAVYFYVTRDGGNSWSSTTSLSISLSISDFIDLNHGWIIDSTQPVLYATSDAAQHWTKINASANFKNITTLNFVTTQVGWAISNNDPNPSVLLKTTNGGYNWTEVTVRVG